MALNFPSNPIVNQEYTINGVRYIFDGVSWNADYLHSSAPPGNIEVRFIDIDGSVLKTDFVNIGGTATPPANPDRTNEGLTFVEWNNPYNNVQHDMDIGATYKTTDGKTHIYLELWNSSVLTTTFKVIKSDTSEITIDFGDETTPFTSSASGNVEIEHTYLSIGAYEVTVDITSGTGTYTLGQGDQSSGFCYEFVNYISKIFVGDNCDHIGENCFYGNNVDLISLPNTLSVFNAAFGSGNFVCLIIPRYVSGISIEGSRPFGYMGKVEVISIPNNATFVSLLQTFRYCRNLRKIILPETLTQTETGNDMCEYCNGLLYIYLPNSITHISQDTFYECYGLQKIEGLSHIKTLGISALNNLKSLVIKETITMSFTTIVPSSSFRASCLYHVILEEPTYRLDDYAFYGMMVLKLDLPSTMLQMDSNSLYQCDISELIVRATTPPIINTTTFQLAYCTRLKIYVPDDSVTTYKEATNWTLLADRIHPISDLD